MKELKSKQLSVEEFQKYGYYHSMIDPDTVKIGILPIEFYRDIVPLRLGKSNVPMFSVNRVGKREQIINVSEYHNLTSEGVLPLDGDVLLHVAPATVAGEVPYNQFEVFYVPQGTFVSLNPGVWHHACFSVSEDFVNILIILPERTYVTDCFVHEFPEKDYIKVL